MSEPLQVPPALIDRTKVDQVILRTGPNVQGASMQDETVLLDVSTGRYYTLNRLGSVIWEQCTLHNTVSEIHAVLCNRFDVEPDRALDDLIALVNDLIREGLLQQEG